MWNAGEHQEIQMHFNQVVHFCTKLIKKFFQPPWWPSAGLSQQDAIALHQRVSPHRANIHTISSKCAHFVRPSSPTGCQHPWNLLPRWLRATAGTGIPRHIGPGEGAGFVDSFADFHSGLSEMAVRTAKFRFAWTAIVVHFGPFRRGCGHGCGSPKGLIFRKFAYFWLYFPMFKVRINNLVSFDSSWTTPSNDTKISMIVSFIAKLWPNDQLLWPICCFWP